MQNFLIPSTYFSLPCASSHVWTIHTHMHWIPGLNCNKTAVVTMTLLRSVSKDSSLKFCSSLPFLPHFPSVRPPKPSTLPWPGWSGLLLLIELHKWQNREIDRERERWRWASKVVEEKAEGRSDGKRRRMRTVKRPFWGGEAKLDKEGFKE